MPTLNRAYIWSTRRCTGLLICLFLIGSGITACANRQVDSEPAPSPDDIESLTDVEKDLSAALGSLTDETRQQVVAELRAHLSTPEFTLLEPQRQHYWLHLTADLALQSEDYQTARSLIDWIMGTSFADGEDWRLRFVLAARTDRTDEAIAALMTLARQWPESLAAVGTQSDTTRLVGKILDRAEPDPKYELSAALFTAQWTLPNGFQPSWIWLDLVRMALERGDLQLATKVAAQIADPEAILVMRIDRQFDPLLRAMPGQLDLGAAMKRYLAFLDEMSAKFPRKLAYPRDQIYYLIHAGRFEQALAKADAILAATREPTATKSSYDDYDEQDSWLFDYRASALEGLGRWQEAERSRREAAQLTEDGRPSVNAAINLAAFYARWGRSKEALAALGSLATSNERTSSYGRMQVDGVLLSIALADRDQSAAAAVLERMRKNQANSPAAFQDALILVNRMDEAASVLIQRLTNGDPDKRRDALFDLQIYLEEPLSPEDRLLLKRWNLLRARKDVAKAIAAVGRVERVPVLRPWW